MLMQLAYTVIISTGSDRVSTSDGPSLSGNSACQFVHSNSKGGPNRLLHSAVEPTAAFASFLLMPWCCPGGAAEEAKEEKKEEPEEESDEVSVACNWR